MKVFLTDRNRDFDLKKPLPWNAEALAQDLELETLLNAMSRGDELVHSVGKAALLSSLDNCDSILYRQKILKDCMAHPQLIRQLYDLSAQALEAPRQHMWGSFLHYPNAILDSSVEVMKILVDILRRIRALGEEAAETFVSEGFRRFWTMIAQELNDEYFKAVRQHLKDLKFGGGILISARLSDGNKGTNYVLRKPKDMPKKWTERLFGRKEDGYAFYIADRDESGWKALSAIRDEGINLAANALAQSTDHVLNFFTFLRTELAFYIGCTNLAEQLAQLGEPIAFPEAAEPEERAHDFRNLYDACLALTKKEPVVGNDFSCGGIRLVIVTGANQGGKSTFLRSVGLAQLMMQCGMFVCAESFRASLCTELYTHYRREEDFSMTRGKLDEELERMSNIVDHISPNSMILLNESFAATNEREGSEIARQITKALLDKQIKVVFVTHLYEFAHTIFTERDGHTLFLRAQRKADGKRTFRLECGEPMQTSFGEDLYRKIFSGQTFETESLPQREN